MYHAIRNIVFLFMLSLALACGDSPRTKTDSLPAARVTPADTIPALAVAVPLDTMALIRANTHVVGEERDPLAISVPPLQATVITRHPALTGVLAFAIKSLRYGDSLYSLNGMLIYLGEDSAGGDWTIESLMTSDASGNYRVSLKCREGRRVTRSRLLLDQQDDFSQHDPATLSRENYLAVAEARLAKWIPFFGIENLRIDTSRIVFPSKQESIEHVRFSLRGKKTGKTSWYFGYTTDMCWYSYYWET